MARYYRIISADSHLEISPEMWTDRLPKKYRDRAPRRVTLPDGSDGCLVENQPLLLNGLNLAGKPYEELSPLGVSWDGAAGAGEPAQRIAEQDRDGIDAEVLFTGVGGPNLWRGIGSNEAYGAVLRAYNDFLAEDYCSVDPDRLIGLGVVPETSVDDAIAEMEHCAKLGLKGITLNAFPSGKGLVTPQDDSFWAAAIDLDIALTVHVVFGFPVNYAGPAATYPQQPDEIGQAGNDVVRRYGNYAIRGGRNAMQLVFGGVFDRFPQLKIYFAETQIGWIPNWLEQMDYTYDRNRHWSERLLGMKPLKRQPSEYIREHTWWGVLLNPIGVRMRHEIGVDRIMWATDFPHSETDWPNSHEVSIKANFDGVPDDEVQRMVAGNAIDFFKLDAVAQSSNESVAAA